MHINAIRWVLLYDLILRTSLEEGPVSKSSSKLILIQCICLLFICV